MRIYFTPPNTTGDPTLDKLWELLYENFMLKLQWQLRNFEGELAKYPAGVIEVYYREQGPGLRIEGFPAALEGKILGCAMLLDKRFVKEVKEGKVRL